MSVAPKINRVTVPSLAQMKGKRKIVVLTAYTAPFASILDPHVDVLLVGDSLGMVLYGMESTIPVSLEMMALHGRTVVNASSRAMVIVDMPFGSYQASKEEAFNACAYIMKETGAAAVKLEGGEELADTVSFLAKRGIPVMAHIGLKPQHVHVMGGYRYQGRTEEEQKTILREAQAFEHTGAFALLLEGMDSAAAANVTGQVNIPTIGIGAGAGCDGQVLVTEDMVGMFASTPRFVKQFGDLRGELEKAVKAYADEVRGESFPTAEHGYGEKPNPH